MTTSIVPFNPQEAVQLAIAMKQVVVAVSKEVLKEDVDFGKIPGTEKNVLFKPGAERLCAAFKLTPIFEVMSQAEDFERGFFFYRYSCALVHRETGEVYGRGIGSCNSQEGKYGWRWVTTPPSHLDPSTLMTRSGAIQELKFAIDKSEEKGPYGKPAEYWSMWKQAIADGTARRVSNDKARKNKKGEVMETWEMGGIEYRIPNPDVFDLVNTIDKMAQKRALIAATLIATNASEFFTQDMEDFAHDLPKPAAPTVIIEGQFEEVAPQKPAAQEKADPSNGDATSTDWANSNVLIKWAWNTLRVPKEGLPAALKAFGKPVEAMSKDEVKSAVLASAGSYQTDIIQSLGAQHGLPNDIIADALLIKSPILTN